jgi:hypothetical protein
VFELPQAEVEAKRERPKMARPGDRNAKQSRGLGKIAVCSMMHRSAKLAHIIVVGGGIRL